MNYLAFHILNVAEITLYDVVILHVGNQYTIVPLLLKYVQSVTQKRKFDLEYHFKGLPFPSI